MTLPFSGSLDKRQSSAAFRHHGWAIETGVNHPRYLCVTDSSAGRDIGLQGVFRSHLEAKRSMHAHVNRRLYPNAKVVRIGVHVHAANDSIKLL